MPYTQESGNDGVWSAQVAPAVAEAGPETSRGAARTRALRTMSFDEGAAALAPEPARNELRESPLRRAPERVPGRATPAEDYGQTLLPRTAAKQEAGVGSAEDVDLVKPADHAFLERVAHKYAYGAIGPEALADLAAHGYGAPKAFVKGQMVVYVVPNVEGGSAILAFRGTDSWPSGLSALEAGNNDTTANAYGPEPGRAQLVKYYTTVKSAVDEATSAGSGKMIIVGHSLGGAEAQATASMFPALTEEVVGFQPAPVSSGVLSSFARYNRGAQGDDKVRATMYVTDGDVVPTLGDGLLGDVTRVHPDLAKQGTGAHGAMLLQEPGDWTAPAEKSGRTDPAIQHAGGAGRSLGRLFQSLSPIHRVASPDEVLEHELYAFYKARNLEEHGESRPIRSFLHAASDQIMEPVYATVQLAKHVALAAVDSDVAFVGGTVESIVQSSARLVRKADEWRKSGWEAAKSTTQAAVASVVAVGRQVAEATTQVASEAYLGAKNFAGKAKDTAAAMYTATVQKAKVAIPALVRGASHVASSAAGKVKSAAGKTWDGTKRTAGAAFEGAKGMFGAASRGVSKFFRD